MSEFNWRYLLESGRWRSIEDGYARGRQRITRHQVRSSWIYYPDVRHPSAFVFRRLTTALRNARRP